MSKSYLETYLNDHLAGASAAVEMLGLLRQIDPGNDWTGIEAEIVQDRLELQQLMKRANIGESRTRQAVAWLSEKLTELKSRLDDESGGPLRRLELVELLGLGIDGKRALWAALQTAADVTPALRDADYDRLIRRAEQQRATVETRRLAIGAVALAGA
jgi:hypothetical protein